MSMTTDPTGISRRGVLQTAIASAAVATVGAGGLLVTREISAAKPDKGGVTRNPLYVPPTVSPGNFSISAAPSQADLGGGQLSRVLAYNGGVPGPTFRTTTGSSANIQFSNGLDDETTIHWHGMIVETAADGHPGDAVVPGGTYNYTYPIIQRACMNWYHPHPHTLTGEQVAFGLAGAFIINDNEEAALGLPTGQYEVPLVIRDTKLDRTGNLTFKASKSGFLGDTPLVNGTLDPTLDVDTAVYRLRVLNGANARNFRIALNNGAPFTVIGNDGGLLETATNVSQIEFAPGERLDLLVDFRNLAVGDKVMLQDVDTGWDLIEFVVTQTSNNPGTIPTGTLSTVTPLTNPVVTREFSFDGMTRINGQVYELDRIDFQVPRNQTELWRFTTGGNAPHPVHVHGASYQVVSRTGGRNTLYPWEGGWKDTVLLNDGETVEILIRFDDNAGFAYPAVYVMHCHKLSHEDAGMMLNFEVV